MIRATNQAITGNISGIVQPFDARAVVYAIAGSDTLSSTFADENNGQFLLVGLEQGSFDVTVEPREAGFTGTRIDGVSVTVNETTDPGTIELDAE